jgi:hypothetical protein
VLKDLTALSGDLRIVVVAAAFPSKSAISI